MRTAIRLFAALSISLLLVPAARAADRMWVGFHDDPVLRWDAGRQQALDRVAANGATVVRTLVEWHRIAPTKPANAANAFDPAYRFDDLDEFVRNAQVRGVEVLITLWGTPGWANGNAKPNVLPTNPADFGTFARAVASRYSGRYPGFPFVRFWGIWNESNLGLFLSPQFDETGSIVSARNYAQIAATGYAGIKGASPKALVAIGETSSNGRDRKVAGLSDTVRPGTFMKLVAAASPKLKFDAWAQHPYPFPVNQSPTQKALYPNVTFSTLGKLEADLDAAFGRKEIPIWVTEYGNETKPGEPTGVTEAEQAAYAPKAIELAKADPRVQMFVWFVLQDSPGSPWQSGIYRQGGVAKPAQARFRQAALPLSPVHGVVALKAGTRNPAVTVYLRYFCANNAIGTRVGLSILTKVNGKQVQASQEATTLAQDCTVAARLSGLTVAKGKTYVATILANTMTTANVERTITVVGT